MDNNLKYIKIANSFEFFEKEKSTLAPKDDSEDSRCRNEDFTNAFANDPAKLCKKEVYSPEKVTTILNTPCQSQASYLKIGTSPKEKSGRCFKESCHVNQYSDGTTDKKKWLQYFYLWIRFSFHCFFFTVLSTD